MRVLRVLLGAALGFVLAILLLALTGVQGAVAALVVIAFTVGGALYGPRLGPDRPN